jgi:hypothetical protein
MLRRRLENLVRSVVRSLLDKVIAQLDRTVAAKAALPARTITVQATEIEEPKPAAKSGRKAKPAAAPVPAAAPTLTAQSSYEGTVWLPRILWALDQARRKGEGGKSAADLARILADEAGLKVAPNNVARAFRDLKGKPYAKGLWLARQQKYTITKAGQNLLAEIL